MLTPYLLQSLHYTSTSYPDLGGRTSFFTKVETEEEEAAC